MDFNSYILNEKDNIILSLNRLVSINSVTGEPKENAPFGKGPKDALEEVKIMAEEMGLCAEIKYNRVAVIDLKPNVFPKVGILAHADVVPAGNGWDYEPFKATVEGDNIYGRGVIDNKGPIVSVLYSMKFIKENMNLKNNFRLIVGSDEECGSSDLEYYRNLDKLPQYIFTPDANYPLINIEKGRATGKFVKKIQSNNEKYVKKAYGGTVINAVPDRAYAEFYGFKIDELEQITKKCNYNVKYEFKEISEDIILMTVYGMGAHASLPEGGENALTALCEFLSYADNRFKCISKACPHGDYCGKSLGIDACDDISGALTFSFDIMKYENELFEGCFDIRFPVCVKGEELEDRLHNSFSFYGFDVENYESTDPHHTDRNSILVKSLLETYEKVTGKKGEALAVGGGTYAHGIEGAVAFGPEIPGIDNRIHGANEFISIDHLLMNTRMMYEAIIGLDSKM